MANNTTCRNLYKVLWLKYGDLSAHPMVQTFFAILYTIILLFGLIGNGWVVVAVKRNRALHSVRNLFIVSLSCSDICVCLVSGTITPITAMAKIWFFGKALCKGVPLIQGTTICVSTFTLATISIDRLILIVFPTRRPIKQNHAICIISIIWAAAIALSLPAAIHQFLGHIGHWCHLFCMERWPTVESRKVYGTAVLIVQFLLPLVIIAFSYGAICLRLSQGMLHRKASQMSERQDAALKRRRRTNRMLMAMVAAFAGSWCPQVMFNLVRDYALLPVFMRRQEYLHGILVHCIAMSSTCWNPLLYAWLNDQLRSAFMALLPKWCAARRSTDEGRLLQARSSYYDGDRTITTMSLRYNSPLLNTKAYGACEQLKGCDASRANSLKQPQVIRKDGKRTKEAFL